MKVKRSQICEPSSYKSSVKFKVSLANRPQKPPRSLKASKVKENYRIALILLNKYESMRRNSKSGSNSRMQLETVLAVE